MLEDRDNLGGTMICDGCGQPIVEGQHYMKVNVEFATRMPEGWVPVREVEPTTAELNIHNPDCFLYWGQSSELVKNVFA